MAVSASDSTNTMPTRVADAVKSMVSDTYRMGAAARGEDPINTRTIESGQMTGQFTMMVQVAVTLAVGVLIVGQIFDALPSSDGPLANASVQVEEMTATAFELAPIVLIVVVAALVIGVVRRI